MTESVFAHSTPALYHHCMGPLLLFEPYAEFVAGLCALLQPARILETAAGSGIVPPLLFAIRVTRTKQPGSTRIQHGQSE